MLPRTTMVRGRVLPISAPPISDGAVVVEEGKVLYVGPAVSAPRLSGPVIEIEAGDGTVLPGLIDAHVHLVADGGADFAAEVVGIAPEALALKAYANALRALHNGVVAMRDLGAPHRAAISVAEAIRDGRLFGPEVATAGRAITVPGGHITYLGVEVDGDTRIADVAREELRRGADGIKLVATGGVLTPDVSIDRLPFEETELAEAAAVGAAAGTWVAAHVIGYEGTKRALRAGATTIEHGAYLDDEAIELMDSRGAVLVATRTALVQILKNTDSAGFDEAVLQKAHEIYDINVESLRKAASAGIPIAAATDAGTPFNPHGRVAEEARLLVEDIGLSAEAAVRAATTTAARCLMRDDLGHVSVGVPGHLVVVDGDPLDDISALGRVRTVVFGGHVVTESGERKT